MKKFLLLFSLVIACSAIASARPIIYRVGPFDKLSLLGDIDIVYKSNPDSIGIAVYNSDTDYSDAIEVSNTKGKLSIRVVPGHDMGPLPTLTVYSDYLSKVQNESNSTVTAWLSASTPTFSARLTGNGRVICENISSPEVSASITTGNGSIVLRGSCREAKFSLTGAGLIQADGLAADVVKCKTLGTGSIGCHAIETLDVRGVGTTKIYYMGTPKVKKVGTANVMPLEEDSDTGTLTASPDPDDDEVTEVSDNDDEVTEASADDDDEEGDDEEEADDDEEEE